MLIIYSIFCLALFFREKISRMNSRVPFPLRLIAAFIITGFISETLAWTGSFFGKEEAPALFHPQLFPDLYMSVGFYGGWGVALYFILKLWKLGLKEIFIMAGIIGVAIEQNSAVLLLILQALTVNPLIAIFMALFLFVVYGSIAGLAFILAGKDPGTEAKEGRWYKYPVTISLMYISSLIFFYLLALLGKWAGLIPEVKKIYEHPFF